MTNVPTAVLVKLLRTVANAMTEAANDLHKLSASDHLPPKQADAARPAIPSTPPPAPK